MEPNLFKLWVEIHPDMTMDCFLILFFPLSGMLLDRFDDLVLFNDYQTGRYYQNIEKILIMTYIDLEIGLYHRKLILLKSFCFLLSYAESQISFLVCL